MYSNSTTGNNALITSEKPLLRMSQTSRKFELLQSSKDGADTVSYASTRTVWCSQNIVVKI